MPTPNYFKLEISNSRWILLFACLSMFALGMADNIRGPLFLELINYFKLSNTEASVSFAITAAFAFIGNWSSSVILKFVTLPKLLMSALVVMGGSLFVMGMANSFHAYLLGAVFFGLSMGLLGVAQNLIVVENLEDSAQTKALSGLHSLYAFSSLVAPFVASYAPVLLGPWRSAFFVAAGLSLVVFILSISIKPSSSIRHAPTTQDEVEVSRLFSLLVFGGILAFYGTAETLVSSRLALYMRFYFATDLKESSLYVTYFFSFMLLGRSLFAFFKIVAPLRKQLNLLLVLSLVCLIFGLIAHPLFLALTGLTMAAFYPLAMAYISEQTKSLKRKYITFGLGFQNVCLICMHLGVGFLTDEFGLIYAFGVGVFSLVLALICVNFHPRVTA